MQAIIYEFVDCILRKEINIFSEHCYYGLQYKMLCFRSSLAAFYQYIK